MAISKSLIVRTLIPGILDGIKVEKLNRKLILLKLALSLRQESVEPKGKEKDIQIKSTQFSLSHIYST